MYLIIYIFALIVQLALGVRGILFERLGECRKKSSMKGGSIALQCRTIWSLTLWLRFGEKGGYTHTYKGCRRHTLVTIVAHIAVCSHPYWLCSAYSGYSAIKRKRHLKCVLIDISKSVVVPEVNILIRS